MPPTSHARYTSFAEPTACIISAGTRKIPLPMIVPTTTADAWLTPRSRASSGRGVVNSAMVGVSQYTRETCGVAYGKRHHGSYHYPPSPRNVRPPQIQFHGEAEQHAYN